MTAPVPASTIATASRSGIGASAHRREDATLVTGRGSYVPNLRLEGMVECSFVRSSLAHGLIRSVDVSEARSQPGVVAAYSAADLHLGDIPELTTAAPVEVDPRLRRPPLASERVRFVGEPLAVVVAHDRYLADDAVEFAEVDIDPLPAITDVSQARDDETLLFPEVGTNLAATRRLTRGDVDEADASEIVVELETEHPRLAPAPMETLGIVVRPEPDGTLTVWCGTQSPHRLRRQMAGPLGMEESDIRIIVPDMGGGFGTKNSFYPEYLVVAACARELGRPARWLAARSESLVIGTHGRSQRHRIRLSGDRDGRLRRASIEIDGDVGAYPHNGAVIPMFGAAMGAGPYDIEVVDVQVRTYLTNRATTGPYRGAGRPESTFTLERAIEAFAHAAGLDPIEVRLQNFVSPEAMPYDNGVGGEYDSGDYAACLRRAVEMIDLEALRAEQQQRMDAGDTRLLGIGVGAFVERAGASNAPEYARIELEADGTLVTRVGTADMGQGNSTTWSQIVANVFDVHDESTIGVITGDTQEVAQGTGSFASRSTQTGGSAVLRSARRLRRTILEVVSQEIECSLDDLVVEDATFGVRGDPSTSVSLVDVAAMATERGVDLVVEESFSLGNLTFPYGSYLAVVEVDRDTGTIDIRDLVAVDDCGNVVNPEIVEGQIHGSVAQGLGQALFEEFVYDESGQPLTSTFVDYLMPGAPDLPPLRSDRTVTPSPLNPLGAKGTGEAGCIGAPPAVVIGVLDALRPLGVEDLQMPLSPQRVWKAIQAVTA